MDIQKTVLVVDDSTTNRSILCDILHSDYTVIQAENGIQALTKLKRQDKKVDAIILDIIMPEMDGYEFMNKIKQDKTLSQIPVIILTEKSDRDTEKKVLESGAWDFVPKPYDAEIIKLRLKNVIARSQVSLLKELNNVMNYDPLTEIYSKNKFFSASKALLKAYPDKQFAFLRLDIDRFKLINSFFGTAYGDRLLKRVAKRIRDFAKTTECCTFGRIDADVFGIFTPYQGKEETVKQIEQAVEDMKKLSASYNIMIVYGVYVVTDRSLPISFMCDRAALAAHADAHSRAAEDSCAVLLEADRVLPGIGRNELAAVDDQTDRNAGRHNEKVCIRAAEHGFTLILQIFHRVCDSGLAAVQLLIGVDHDGRYTGVR